MNMSAYSPDKAPADMFIQNSFVQCSFFESSELKIAMKKTRHRYINVESHGQRADLNLNLFNFTTQVEYCKLKTDEYNAGSQALEDVIISIFFL